MGLILRIVLLMAAAFALLHGAGVLSQRISSPIDGKPPSTVRLFAPRTPSDDPRADAAVAIRLGDFRLIGAGQFGGPYPAGITCFTPGGVSDGLLSSIATGDYMTPEVARLRAYAAAYNLAIVASPDFPAADICRPAGDGDPRVYPGVVVTDRPARVVTGPVHSLHEAARRGSADDVRKFLATTSVAAIDGTGMTALAWATARGNAPAIDALLDAGADPWEAGDFHGWNAVYWATATGRQAIFDRLRHYPRPQRLHDWQSADLAAAMQSGNVAIVETILREPHQPLSPPYFGYVLPTVAAVEPILRAQPDLADALLVETLDGHDDIRLDLVQLALRYHADPNVTSIGRESTPLGNAAHGYYDGSDQAVDLLLKAGADANRPADHIHSRFAVPAIWVAVNSMSSGSRNTAGMAAIYDRQERIVKRLAAAGADLNQADREGKPPIWFLLTPTVGLPESIAAMPTMPDVLHLLARLGMDPNARWKGRTILPLVEKQLGSSHPIAVTLRELGAH